MPTKKEPLVLRSISIPASLDERLRQQAVAAGCTKGELIRELLMRGLQ